jgi:hypothetical protein
LALNTVKILTAQQLANTWTKITARKAITYVFAESPIRNAEVRAKLFTSASGPSVRATKVGGFYEIDIPLKV